MLKNVKKAKRLRAFYLSTSGCEEKHLEKKEWEEISKEFKKKFRQFIVVMNNQYLEHNTYYDYWSPWDADYNIDLY